MSKELTINNKKIDNLILTKEEIIVQYDSIEKQFNREFNYETLLSRLNDIEYNPPKLKFDKDAQDDTNGLQFFTSVFLEMFYSDNLIPSVVEFISYYTKNYLVVINDYNVCPIDNTNCILSWSGVRDRLYKVYPSLVAELLFTNMLLDKLNCKCYYDYTKDIYNKKDFCIETEKKNIAVVMLANSKNAINFEKQRKSKPNDDWSYITIIRDISGKELYINGISLYGEKSFNTVKSCINLYS